MIYLPNHYHYSLEKLNAYYQRSLPECVTCDTPNLSEVSNFSQFSENSINAERAENESPYSILQNLRVKNVDKIILGHININSIRNKFDLFMDLVKDKIDVILISENKLDSTFPKTQFKIDGFDSTIR